MNDEERQKMREKLTNGELAFEKMRNKAQFDKLKSNYDICVQNNIFFKYKEEEYCNLGFPHSWIFCINILISLVTFFILPELPEISLIILFSCYITSLCLYPNFQKKFYYLKEKGYQHNVQLFKQKYNEYVNAYGVVTKMVICKELPENIEKLLVYDDKKELLYVNMIFDKFLATTKHEIISCSYNEVLRYELIDKTTSQLIGNSSTTSSNVGKAIGGAIATRLLFGNGTIGAIIGSSGKKNTNTTYQTKTTEKYILNIYLNKLDNSIIKIETDNRNIISNIISIVEYIINSKNKTEI